MRQENITDKITFSHKVGLGEERKKPGIVWSNESMELIPRSSMVPAQEKQSFQYCFEVYFA